MTPDRSSIHPPLQLVLFAKHPSQIRRALDAGIDSLIVDLEWRGKEVRQREADTEVNRDRPADLVPMTDSGVPQRFCRLDALGPWTPEQVEAVVAAGATHLLLPMVRSPHQAEELLRLVDGRCASGILIETREAVAAAADLGSLPLDLVYVGLNDLAIERGSASLFDAVADGTVERIRQALPTQRFGFGGVTVVDHGSPIPCPLLLAEMARLDTDFSFLRRSFHRDTGRLGSDGARDWGTELGRVQELWQRLRDRTDGEVEADRLALGRALAA